MKNIILFFLIINAGPVKATNYYFSSLSGDDHRTSLQAQSPSTPWKTLNKLTSFFSELKPGDSVLLKRGDIFYGYFAGTRSGTANSPIVIGAYGSGHKPIISGFTSLTWSALGNNIYISQELNVSEVNVLTINGSLTPMGRYPNNGYLSVDSHSGTSSITNNSLAATPVWTGAELVLRTRRWITDRNLITNHTGNTIFYTPSSKYEPKDKFGYFIQNSPLTLDEPGEWYYDPSVKKVSLYYRSVPKDVTVATIDNLISFSNQANITLNNLDIQGANKNAININGGSKINILNCDVGFSGEDGVKANYHINFRMENCSVINSLNNGIDLGRNSTYVILRNNLVQNTAVFPGTGLSGDGKGIAILTTGSNSLIEFNRVINTGYIGINFGGDSSTVKNNVVDRFCTVKDDGGGIYINVKSSKPLLNRKITGNIVMNGVGDVEGTDNPKDLQASGIYMDVNTGNVEISDNTITACNNNGIYLHSSFGIVIKNNTLFDNYKQLGFVERAGNSLVRNNITTQNIFFAKAEAQKMIILKSSADDTGEFGRFDSNWYVKPMNNRMIIFNKNFDKTGNKSEADGWKEKQAAFKGFAESKSLVNETTFTRFEYNATQISKTINLDGSYKDVRGNKYSKTLTLQPYTSVILIKEK